MNKNLIRYFLSLISFYASLLNANQPKMISLEEALNLAEQNSYAIAVSQYQALAEKKGILIARAGYFPVVNFEMIDSWGFSGSSGWIGVEGLMGSPYRKELSGGLVARQVIYDFGRTEYDIKKSRYQTELAKQNTKVTAYDVKLLALVTYYDYTQYQELENIWHELSKEADIITKEVKKFVNTGQRSIVDKYLSEIQLEEAKKSAAFFAEKAKGAKRELSIIIGLNENTFHCNHLVEKTNLQKTYDLTSSPFLAKARADLKIAEATLAREKADIMPKIISVASIGAMEKTHIVDKKGYAFGIGFIMPLYDLRVVGGIKKAREVLSAKSEEVAAQVQYLEEMNAKYDTIINSSLVKLEHLNRELALAKEGFKIAKHRYFALEGPIIDVREAFKDLAQTSIEIEDANLNLQKSRGAKNLLNGA